MPPRNTLIIIKGAGDIATGVAHRLHRCGYALLMLELERPTAIRRTVAFSQAMYDGQATVEGITAERASLDTFRQVVAEGRVPVVTGAETERLEALAPAAFVEATLSKKNTGLTRRAGRTTLALGPGYVAGQDADAVVETNRGHFLGRLILEGTAEANTGQPGLIGGYDRERLLLAPAAGEAAFTAQIGQAVTAGETLGRVGDAPITAAIGGVLRGALQNGLTVPQNFKIGDIDPRPEAGAFIHTPSDKARAVAGGVLEGLLYFGVTP
ncbi:MAG: EF2563 family selenium-dependent molybdenum hydroxylase system protein [Candidatus Adiutrix sp.]|jgi:xanthine dehydrogenase accessory factor|nr:EF2563 family selenium-dependent molybdenum hydroxylase system protein [Candidatus Adiutrix sp.]